MADKIVTLSSLDYFKQRSDAEMHEYVQDHIVQSHTTAEWAAQSTLRSEKGVAYYYSDIKNFKIGDGISYLSTLPFVLDTDEWKKHMDYSMSDSTETLTLTKNF